MREDDVTIDIYQTRRSISSGPCREQALDPLLRQAHVTGLGAGSLRTSTRTEIGT